MDDWAAYAKHVLRSEMTRRKMSYADLATALRGIGVEEVEYNVRNKIGRGTYSAVFLFQCLTAMGVSTLRIDCDVTG